MKIKTDFVTNSSSTSFLLVCNGDFTLAEFVKLVGVENASPLMPIFKKLYELIKREMKPIEDWRFEQKLEELHPNVAKKLVEYRSVGKVIYEGELSTEDGDPIEAMFCVDSFEAENENIYLNYLECVW